MAKHFYDHDSFYIPMYMAEGLLRYINEGILPGDFLQGILTNDLVRAFSHADRENKGNIPAYVAWLYNNAPVGCWGSRIRVENWVKEKREEQKHAQSGDETETKSNVK